MLQGCDYMSQVKLGSKEVKLSYTFKQVSKVTPFHELHYHVEILSTLERVDTFDDEVVRATCHQNIFLVHDQIIHIFLDHHLFV